METILVAEEPAADVRRPSVGQVWGEVFRLTWKRPSLLAPFLLGAAVEFYILLILSDTPAPLRGAVDPLIRFFYGPDFVDYPMKISIVPELFSKSRTVIAVLLGSLLSAWTAAAVIHLERHGRRRLRQSLKDAAPRYVSLVAITVLALILSRALTNASAAAFGSALFRRLSISPVLDLSIYFLINFALVTIVVALFVYAIPALIADRLPLGVALRRSLRVATRSPLHTLFLVLPPAIPYFVLAGAVGLSPILLGTRSIETTANLFLATILLSFVSNYLIVTAAAVFYLDDASRREQEN